MSNFEELGGEPKLRAIVDDFVDRCFDDMMIGFLFQRADRDRIKRFEYEHAAEHLGADVQYGGRPLDVPFRPAGDVPAARNACSVSYGGQFHRRTLVNCVSAMKNGARLVSIEVIWPTEQFAVPTKIGYASARRRSRNS